MPINPAILSFMNAGNRFVQKFVPETIAIGVPGMNYTCTIGRELSLDLDYETGGAVQKNRGSVLVNKQDLATAPPRGTIVNFRGAGFRVTEVSDCVAVWEISIIQLSA